jgi:AcrR family transcriptional regulator
VVGNSLGGAADRTLVEGKALISAASRLIMRSGGAEFNMQNVAAEAGVSRRVLYRLFSGRDDLIVALREESQLVFARLIREHADRYSDPMDRLGAALSFASDTRQLTDHSYNTAMMRLGVEASLNAAGALGRAHRPVVHAFTDLAADALSAGRLRPGDPRTYGEMLDLAVTTYHHSALFRGDKVVDQDAFLRFCLAGLGADVPTGWLERFRLDDDEAAVSRARTYELSGTIRRMPSRSNGRHANQKRESR